MMSRKFLDWCCYLLENSLERKTKWTLFTCRNKTRRRRVDRKLKAMGFHSWVEAGLTAADRVSWRSTISSPILHTERRELMMTKNNAKGVLINILQVWYLFLLTSSVYAFSWPTCGRNISLLSWVALSRIPWPFTSDCTLRLDKTNNSKEVVAWSTIWCF